MRRFSSRSIWGGLLVAVWLCHAAGAQEQQEKAREKEVGDPKATTRVTLGTSSGTPGNLVVVPIYFTPAQGAEVGRLKLEVNYVSANLTFTNLDAGLSAQMGGVDLRSEVKAVKNDTGVDSEVLLITASFLSAEPPQKGIPGGLLGYLSFKISENGRPASIRLRAAAEANELGTNKPFQNVRAFEGKVEVLAPGSLPMVTCFFFSH